MKIIPPSFEFEPICGEEILRKIEHAGRVCYKSEDKITETSAQRFVAMLIKHGHESVLEHVQITARVVCDRGVTHEIVRHRLASYSQESTRYCNYAKGAFGSELTFIKPCFWAEDSPQYALWHDTMAHIEQQYLALVAAGATAEQARSILPNSLKTEIVMSLNLRAWRHFFALRCAKQSHPQMREIACMMLQAMQQAVPVVFEDLQL
ncbi:MAG: FAD-dependent thymidylate synthase [Oscillospiraceae bacterium]|nr:FAD-dependent thymidylate synthase [Oscillospiraceae bacterium]